MSSPNKSTARRPASPSAGTSPPCSPSGCSSTTSTASTSPSPTTRSLQPSAYPTSSSACSPAPITGPTPSAKSPADICWTASACAASVSSAHFCGASLPSELPPRRAPVDSSPRAFSSASARHPLSPQAPKPSATGFRRASAASLPVFSTHRQSFPPPSASRSSACSCSASDGASASPPPGSSAFCTSCCSGKSTATPTPASVRPQTKSPPNSS